MSERKYYCYCEDNCKFETMTKEQILSAIAQAAETGLVIDPDAGVISKVKEVNAGGYVTFWVGTQAQYNALESIDANCFYIITDDTSKQDIEDAVAEALATSQNALDAVQNKYFVPPIIKLDAGSEPFEYMFYSDEDFLAFLDSEAEKLELYTQKTACAVLSFEPFYDFALVTISKGYSDSERITHVSVVTTMLHMVRYCGDLGWTNWRAVNTNVYVTNEYKQGIWKVRKWSNGECELWTTVEAQITFSSWGNLYAAHNAFDSKDYPVTFSTAPIVNATLTPADESSIYGYGLITGQTAGTVSATPSFGAIRATAQSASQSVRLQLYVKGTIAS